MPLNAPFFGGASRCLLNGNTNVVLPSPAETVNENIYKGCSLILYVLEMSSLLTPSGGWLFWVVLKR